MKRTFTLSLISAALISASMAATAASNPVTEVHSELDYEPTSSVMGDEVRTRVNKFTVETADGKHRFGVRGRIMLDAAYLDDNYMTTDDDRLDRGDLAKYGTIIRRARLGMLGVMYDRWEWQVEVDFRDPVTYDIEEGDDIEGIRFANTYVAYLFDHGRLAVGHFKEPFSMESSTSSRRISFIERATPVDAYRPSREMGIMYETLNPNYYAALGLFGGDGVSRNRTNTEGYSIAGRAAFSPVYDASARVWSHLGVSLNYRSNGYEHEKSRGRDKEYNDIRLRSRLGTRAIDGRVIGRRDFSDVKDMTRYAIEAAYGVGSFSIQGEYVGVKLNRDEDARGFENPDVVSISNGGYYVQTSFFTTGEQRNYRRFSGDFGRTRVQNPVGAGGYGAIELLARYAYADHTDHHDERGAQELKHYTLGLNWYPVDDIVLKFNAMYVDAKTSSRNLAAGEFKTWDSMVYALRFQFEF
ncbi:porin [Alkalimonas sp.]|uniref:OprO/OprP family phosphate-selective porin n=1 Tax=Alkalimonas sp. TaxID=1872453 RepID=UPI00263B5B81|nr:porin [Alkalimonas sp.]MCC5827147.1 hypothetical protein [Alkalimonas sp.]